MGLPLAAEPSDLSVGRFINVDGTRLHYLDTGTGPHVVFLHGNGSTIADFVSSGLTERVAAGSRVIVFDRPGFGYSERPPGRRWGPFQQAELLLRAFSLLEIERPVVVGHSWGALVALALGLEAPTRIAGLILLSGYYYPIRRAHASPLAVPMLPMMDDVLRQAVVPFVWRLMAPGTVRRVFAPCAVPKRYAASCSIPHARRASHFQAVADEAATLLESAGALSKLYKQLRVPVRLIAGSDDRIVETNKHSARLHTELSMSTFRNIPGCGHMVHHAAPDEVAAAIADVGEARWRGDKVKPVRRHWLHLGDGSTASESLAAA